MANNIDISKVCDEWNHRTKTCDAMATVSKLDNQAGYFFVSDLQIDLDGSPQAYHPKDKRPPDNNTQAWDWLVNVKVSDLPGIQGVDGAVGPLPGYYISATSYQDGKKKVNDAARYVDSRAISYIVLPSPFPNAGAAYPKIKGGDCAVVVDLKTGQWTGAIYADTGRSVGEASLRVSLNLGFDPRKSKYPPKVAGGMSRKDFFYLVFPGTVMPFPLSEPAIQKEAAKLFAAWGGMAQVRALYPGRTIPGGGAGAAAAASPGDGGEPLAIAANGKPAAKKRKLRKVQETVAEVAALVAPGAQSLNELLSAKFRPLAAAQIQKLVEDPDKVKDTGVKPEDFELSLPALIARYPQLPERSEARAALFARREKEGAVKLLAEGDSWFDFPFPLYNSPRSDVLDALASTYKYAVVRDSKRGDVVSRMCQADNIAHFVNLARLHKPKAFLFSGGGNDYVGGDPAATSKLFKMINPKGSGKPPLDAVNVRKFARELMGQIDEFVSAMATLEIPVIFHGYANAIPDGRPAFWKVAGPWLKPATKARGYKTMTEARPVITEFLAIYNNELRDLAERRRGKLFYVDCRPVIADKDWHDELHLRARGFVKVAGLFDQIIRSL